MVNPKNWQEIKHKYKGTDYEDDIIAVEKKQSILKKLSKSARSINTFRIIFNNLCPGCKVKVVRNPRMQLNSYCNTCRVMAEQKLKKVHERINK